MEIVVDAKVTGSPEGSTLRGRKRKKGREKGGLTARRRERERGGEKRREGLERGLRDERELTDGEGVGSTLRRVLQTERPPPPHSPTRRCPPALRSVWNTILLLSDKEAAGASSKYRWPGANDPKERTVAFYGGGVVGVDHVEEIPRQHLSV